jgi:hypothetical protein
MTSVTGVLAAAGVVMLGLAPVAGPAITGNGVGIHCEEDTP